MPWTVNDQQASYTIRLSQEHRVVFKIIGEMVQVLKIGGHYP
ncbi:MAG TPA: hypothetical protein VNH11_34185 [Pirellulales bacterium]|nr:hypothetical protein [Pirellulales bacterium]